VDGFNEIWGCFGDTVRWSSANCWLCICPFDFAPTCTTRIAQDIPTNFVSFCMDL